MNNRRTDKTMSIYPYLLPARSIIFLLMSLVCAYLTNRQLEDISNYWSVAASIVNILTIAVLMLAARNENSSYREMITYSKGQSDPKKTILFSVMTIIIGMGGMYIAGLICYGTIMPAVSLKMIAPVPPAIAVINVLVLPVTTALAEDGLYLGGGVGHIRNKYLSVIIPAFFYTLQHCFIPTLFDVRYIVYRFLSFLPLTVIFCLYYQKKKNPLPAMAGHALLDLAMAMSILATSVIPGVYEQWSSMI